MSMELKIYNPTDAQPLPPIQWNYDEVKAWVENGLKAYDGVVYTDDTINQAKKDRAQLNKLTEAIASKRREMKSVYLAPYSEFEKQAKEIEGLIKQQADAIAAQVNAYTEFRKQEKKEKIKNELYTPMIGNLAELVPYIRLHNPKWLNMTCSFTEISQELGGKIDRIISGLSAIDKLGLSSEIATQVKSVFLKNFDLAAALAEKERIENELAELARYEAAQQAYTADSSEVCSNVECSPIEEEHPAKSRYSGDNTAEPIHTVVFRIRVTGSKLKLLGHFMKANGIRPERV